MKREQEFSAGVVDAIAAGMAGQDGKNLLKLLILTTWRLQPPHHPQQNWDGKPEIAIVGSGVFREFREKSSVAMICEHANYDDTAAYSSELRRKSRQSGFPFMGWWLGQV
jgi:hypothetical protein